MEPKIIHTKSNGTVMALCHSGLPFELHIHSGYGFS